MIDSNIQRKFLYLLRAEASSVRREDYPLVAYLIYRAQKQGMHILDEVQDPERLTGLSQKELDLIDYENLKGTLYRKMALEFPQDEVKNILLTWQPDKRNLWAHGSQLSLAKMGVKFLELNSNDKVLDLGSGYGDFIKEAQQYHPRLLVGKEVSSFVAFQTQRVLSLLGIDAEILVCDALLDLEPDTYTKVFCQPPIGEKMDPDYVQRVKKTLKIPCKTVKNISSELLFTLAALETLTKGGKAVIVVSNGALFRKSGFELRKYLVNTEYILGIIQLAPGLITRSNMAVSLIILEKEPHTDILMVDAGNIYTGKGYSRTLTDKDIHLICDLWKEKVEKGTRHANTAEIQENEWSLLPETYCTIKDQLENPRPLKEFVVSMERGTPLSVRDLESLQTEESQSLYSSAIYFVTNGMLRDGMLEYKENPIQLNQLPAKNSRYVIKGTCILIPKTGIDIKTALVSPDPGEILLVSGNLYHIYIDESKIDPVYLQAYLTSDTGKQYLKALYKGTVAPQLSLKDLENLDIPYIDKEEQKSIAKEYLKEVQKIEQLEKELAEARLNLKKIYKK